MASRNLIGSLLNLAVQAHRVGNLKEAIARYEQALAIDPGISEALSNLGLALKSAGRPDEAIRRYQQALDLKPNSPEILSNLGIAFREQGRAAEAVACYRKALTLKPDFPSALSNLGNALKDLGEFDEAFDCYRKALALKPAYPDALANLDAAIFELHYVQKYCERSTLEAARLYGRYANPSPPRTSFRNVPEPGRRLRVGYVSSDFRDHPVGFLIQGPLAAHDPAAVETFCYSNSPIVEETTERIRAATNHWRAIAGKSDGEVDALIQADEIDLLIDVSGHTAGNRLSLFALRPAPVQASWLAYLDTTGVATMDYFLTDRFVVPVEDEASYSEKVLRLPDMHLCLAREDMDVPVIPPSAEEPLTLGSFNNWAKVSDATIALWARVLAELPGSRLMLRTGALNSEDVRRAAVARFAAQGISADRLILQGGAPRRDLLASYNKVDIALDPFPYTGCTTTVEALWMGVPVVTLRGKRSVARASEGILTTAGLPHLVAADEDSYVATVTGLAEDRASLAALRGSLRAKVAQSPLFDCARFTRSLESLYRQMWTGWCARQS